MKFGFLAHAVSPGHRNQVRGLDLLGRLLDDHRGTVREPGPRLYLPLPMLTSVTSLTGSRCSGEIRGLAYTAEQILLRPTTARSIVAAEVTALHGAGADIVGLGGATSIVGDLMCLRFAGQLARDHRILTFVTANRNRVLRIQPPLLLTTEQADRFVTAVGTVCDDLALHADIIGRMPDRPTIEEG